LDLVCCLGCATRHTGRVSGGCCPVSAAPSRLWLARPRMGIRIRCLPPARQCRQSPSPSFGAYWQFVYSLQ
jgi:hypothetical protein